MSAIAAILPIIVKPWMLGRCLVDGWKMLGRSLLWVLSICQLPSSPFTAAVRGAAQAAAAQEKVPVIISVNPKQISKSDMHAA